MAKEMNRQEKRHQKLLDKYADLEHRHAKMEDAVMDSIGILFEALELKFIKLDDQP
jgi:hypothetical protein